MKHLKKIGLVVAAVMAFAAFAGAASASAAEFHSSAPVGTSLHAVQTTGHVFTTQGQDVTCTTATFTGEVEALTSTTQSVHPEYSGCTAFGIANAKVETEGCKYTFHTNTGLVDLSGCTAGFVNITVSIPFIATCVVHVPNQTNINGQTFTTEGTTPNRRIVVDTASTNIAASVVTSSGICPLTVGSATSSYKGATTVTPASGEIWYA